MAITEDIYQRAKSVCDMQIGGFGPTRSQEAYVFQQAAYLAKAIVDEYERTNRRMRYYRLTMPPSGESQYIYINARSVELDKGDENTGLPTTLFILVPGTNVSIDFETDEVEVAEIVQYDNVPF